MKSFDELGLKQEIVDSIKELGFVNPTPIQEKIIPVILDTKKDIIALAQTGTGKTAGFGLPLIQQIDEKEKSIQALILCPTRELCLQITNDLNNFSKRSKHISIVAVYGGAGIQQQMRSLKKNTQIVVGTPGRTLDLIERGALKIDNIKQLVLDEADEMLNMGFRDDLEAITETTPEEKQILLFSATMPEGVRRIAGNYMKDPIEISVGKKNTGAENILHHYYIVKSHDRYVALKRLIDINPSMYGIVFCRTRMETKDVAAHLIKDGYYADALHGDLSQEQRDQVMKRFRFRQIQLLIATDVAARGIDVNDLTHVINYNLPDDPEVYIHRSGRTGRAGKQGVSIILTLSKEGRKIREIEKISGKRFELKKIPGNKEIVQNKIEHFIGMIEKSESNETVNNLFEEINKKLHHLTREELLKKIIALEFNKFSEQFNEKNLNSEFEQSSGSKFSDKDFSRFFINIGLRDKLKVANLIGLINEVTENRHIEIGKVEILKNFSFFEAEKSFEKNILSAFQKVNYNGNEIVVELSKPKQGKDNEFRKDKKFRKEKEFRRDKDFHRGDKDKNGKKKKKKFRNN